MTKQTIRGPAFHLVVICSLMLTLTGTVGGETLNAASFSNGSAKTANETYQLNLSFGHPFVGSLSNATYQMGVGFWYIAAGTGTAPVSDVPPVSYTTELKQNAPNPFNPSTTISFTLAQAGPVQLRLYDVKGRQVATLIDEDMNAGPHSLVFQPRGLASGVYLYQMKTADATETRRLMLLK